MSDFIKELNKRIAEYIGENSKADEDLFNFGVELGRYLEKNSKENIKLDFFVSQIENQNKKDIIFEHKRNIEKHLLSILRMAVKKQVSDGISMTFSNERYYDGDAEFSKEIEEKFNLKYSRVEQPSTNGDFEISYNAINELRDIFDKFDILNLIIFKLENSTGEAHETIYNEDDANDIYSAFIHIHTHNSNFDVNKIAEFENEVSKFLTKLALFN